MPKTTTQAIANAVGGNWHYNRRAGWWQDDKDARAVFVAACGCDDDCTHLPQLWLYGRGIPQRLIPSETTSGPTRNDGTI